MISNFHSLFALVLFEFSRANGAMRYSGRKPEARLPIAYCPKWGPKSKVGSSTIYKHKICLLEKISILIFEMLVCTNFL